MKGTSSLIGNTPLVLLSGVMEHFNLKTKIYAKCEMYNLTGSAKDRVALAIIEDAVNEGRLGTGSPIVEATSGNTGIGLAAVGRMKGFKVIIVMPDNMSKERIDLIRAYGAEVVLTPASKGMTGAVEEAHRIVGTEKGFFADQFGNPSNSKAHYISTGPEIYNQTEGKIDCFVAGIGTGGTITGTGRYLKEKLPEIRITGVEPLSSPVLTEGTAGSHKIQGIGAGFVPPVLDRSLLDEVIAVSDEDAYFYTKLLVRTDGILAGISSGAALKAACDIAETGCCKNITVILPDSGMRYMSTGVFN